ncbi:MAG: hypothetical protein GY756_08120 [bacterium]|nr:hypothetical protein [bacterium]
MKKENLFFDISDFQLNQHYQNKEDNLNKKINRKLSRYLKKSYFLVGALEEAYCIFSKSLIEHYETWYTDGEWVWSADLMHYFKKYHFRWPDEFIQYLSKRKFAIPKISKEEIELLFSDPIFLKYTQKFHRGDFTRFQ